MERQPLLEVANPDANVGEHPEHNQNKCRKKCCSGKVWVYALIVFIQFLNSCYSVLTKAAIKKDKVDPLIFSLYRDALAFPILGTMALVFDVAIPKCKATQPNSTAEPKASLTMRSCLVHTAWFAVLGLTGMFGNQFSYIFALSFVTADMATMLNLAQTIVASAIASSPLVRCCNLKPESCSIFKVLAIVTCVCGAAVIMEPWAIFACHPGANDTSVLNQTNAHNQTGSSCASMAHAVRQLTGLGLVLVSCVCMGFYYNMQKMVLRHYQPVTTTAYSYFFGALIMGLVGSYHLVLGEYDAFVLPASAWPALMFAVCGNSVLKYSLVAVANKYVSVTVLVLASTLVPLFTIVLSYLDPNLRQTPRWSYLGMVLVVLGLAIIVYDRARKGPTAAMVLKTYGSRLQNKVVMVTGANGGLAKELCTQLVRECDLRTLIVHCRRQDAATALCASLQEQRENSCALIPVSGDFSSLQEVQAVADDVTRNTDTLDVLVCVAGIATVPQRMLSSDGYELQFAVNHLAHFHLVSKLTPILECGGGGRVVTVATTQSVIQRAQLDLEDLSSDRSYNMFSAYLGSKLASALHAAEINRRTIGVLGISCDPGNVSSTGIARQLSPILRCCFRYLGPGLLAVSVAEGAATIAMCTAAGGDPHLFYAKCKGHPVAGNLGDEQLAKALWDASIKATE